MGGKKQGIKIFKGSLKTHWLMYVNKIEVNINPSCPLAMKTGTMMYRTVMGLDSKYTQPGF